MKRDYKLSQMELVKKKHLETGFNSSSNRCYYLLQNDDGDVTFDLLVTNLDKHIEVLKQGVESAVEAKIIGITENSTQKMLILY